MRGPVSRSDRPSAQAPAEQLTRGNDLGTPVPAAPRDLPIGRDDGDRARLRHLALDLVDEPVVGRPSENRVDASRLDGIRGGPVPMSNFDYAGPLTEVILLGNVALRSGEKISYDSANLTTGNAEADRFLRNEYRRGYSIGSAG